MRGRDQVMLKVSVSEISRDVIKQLGIDLSGSNNYGSAVLAGATSNAFSAVGAASFDSAHTGGIDKRHHRYVAGDGASRRGPQPGRAQSDRNFRRNSDVHRRRRISTFPTACRAIRPARRRSANQQIDFKKFGVSLAFTPIVIADGRISLKVMTEVSDLSTENSITLAGAEFSSSR